MNHPDGRCEGWHAAISAAAGVCWNFEFEKLDDPFDDEARARRSAQRDVLEDAAKDVEHLKCPYCSPQEPA